MDDQLLEELTTLVGDLAVGPGTTSDDLQLVRQVAATAVAGGQRAVRARSVVPDLGHDAQVLRPLLDEAVRAPRGDLLVARRALPVTSTQPPGSTPPWASGRAIARTIGPFRDRLGRPVWIDLYRIVRHVAFVRTAGGVPFLVLSLSVPAHAPVAPHPSYTIPAGSVWIASRLIAAAAPSGAYTGLRVDGGKLSFSQPVTVVGNEVVVPLGVNCRLELQLHAEATPVGSGDGGDARAALAETPDRATIVIAGATATFSAVTGARVRAYGTTAKLAWQPGAPEYLPEVGRIALPMHPDAAALDVKAVASRLFVPSGTAAITRAGWGLPVAVADPATLGDASGAGALLLWLDAGLGATWIQQPSAVALGPSLVMVDPTRLTLVALTASAQGAQHRVALWEGTPPNVALLRWGQAFALRFFSQAAGAEALWTGASLDATVDRPLDVNGQRLALHASAAGVIHLAWSAGVYLALFTALDADVRRKRIGLGIANAVMITAPPALCLLYVRLDSAPTSGACLLAFLQRALLPTLPDPYAVNLASLAGALDQGSAELLSLVTWSPGHVALDFVLAPDAGSRLPAAPRPGFGFAGTPGELTPAAVSTGGGPLEFERQRGVILLDVSTSSDQFGVAVNRDADHIPSLSINQLYLRARDQDVVLLTLPAVQWEAVITDDDPADPTFPHRLGFANSGVPTLLNVRRVELVRVQPEAALDELVANFARPDPAPTAARFTLPFGILAAATLDKPSTNSPRGAKVDYVRPRKDDLEGAHQLSIRAVDTSLPAGASPSLPGYTIQLPVGQPGSRSVLGSDVTTTFNTYLGPTGFRPLVPVTRLDLTGYGESLFSDWRNPYTDAVAVSQARFDVLIGRTSHEVVQVRSYLYPYAVQVVRTITIERKNSAVVARRDSGWQAVSDGTYQFPAPPQIETHPGVVRRITHVTAIRDTGQVLTLDGVQLAAVRFDGDLELDGAAALVPATDQLGFVQLTAGNVIAPATYQKLIEAAGPLGGAIDANLQVGSGRQRMRVSRVGVGVTQGMGGPEFAMAAWGSPRFPGGGQWSFVQLLGPTEAPIAVPRDGVPLIRAGAASAGPPPVISPYRFADPVDLLQPTNPASDYGILHATGTQRVFFPRPKIEATDTSRITSTQIPAVADPYSLATSLGLFPELSRTIPFPSSNWSLQIDGAGNYQLVQPVNPFPITVGRRTLRQAGSVSGDVDYTGATLRYEVDTAQPVPWRFALDGSSKVMNSTSLGDVVRLGANVRASADQPTTFEQPNLKLGGGLTVVQDLLTILADLGITGVMSAEMNNEWKIKVGLKVPFRDAMGNELQIPPFPFEPPDIIFAETGCSVEVKVWPDADETEFKLGGQPMFAIKAVPGLYAVAIIEFGIKLSTLTGTTYSLTLGVGIAYKIKAPPFELKGLFGITIFGFIGDNVLGWGMGFLVVVSAEIQPIISVELKLEGKLAMVSACRGTPSETLFGAAKLTFAVEVSIFLVFSISFEYETTGSEVLRGPGPPACVLPDVIP